MASSVGSWIEKTKVMLIAEDNDIVITKLALRGWGREEEEEEEESEHD